MPVELSGAELSLSLGESNEEMPVYNAQTLDPGIVTAFVSSEEGKSFQISLKNNILSRQVIQYTAYIDGREMDSLIVRPSCKSRMQGAPVAGGVRPFTFSKLQLKEDDGETSTDDISKLGLIEVHVWRVNVTSEGETSTYYTKAKASLDAVSEKAKKIGWHSVSLGAVKAVRPSSSCTVDFLDPYPRPYAIFRIHYKPRELLEAEGIAPCTELPFNSAKSKKRARSVENEETTSAKRLATERDVKPDILKLSASSSQVKAHGAKSVKKEVIDLTDRPHSPIRVPINKEVIVID